MEWTAFLLWLQDPGISIAVGAVASILVEYWPWFAGLDKAQKRPVFFGLSLVIPVAAAAVSVGLGYQSPVWADTWWPCIVAGFMAFAGGTIAHLKTNKPKA